MKYLIVGLGNPGDEYQDTRHNIGFMVLDALAKASNTVFQDKRYGFVAEMSVKNCRLILLKPTTFMNLSGNAVRYWMNKENITPDRLLVITDDLALPLGKIRLKGQGSNGGHNGLGNIIQTISTQQFARLRFAHMKASVTGDRFLARGLPYPRGFLYVVPLPFCIQCSQREVCCPSHPSSILDHLFPLSLEVFVFVFWVFFFFFFQQFSSNSVVVLYPVAGVCHSPFLALGHPVSSCNLVFSGFFSVSR